MAKKQTAKELLNRDYQAIQEITKEEPSIIKRALKIKEYLNFPEKYWSK